MNNLKEFQRKNNAPYLFFEETVSTMAEAKSAIERGEGDNLLVCAEFQSAGRGRIDGRKWESKEGENLLFSLVVSSDSIKGPLPLSLQTGYGVYSFLDNRFSSELFPPFDCRIKWPNDIYLNNRKLVGILCESFRSYFIIGIGINCNQMQFPSEIEDKATSLALELKMNGDIDRTSILKGVTEQLEKCFLKGITGPDVQQVLKGLGEEVNYIEGDPRKNPVRTGKIRGINNDGSLLLEGPEGLKSLYSGEIIYS